MKTRFFLASTLLALGCGGAQDTTTTPVDSSAPGAYEQCTTAADTARQAMRDLEAAAGGSPEDALTAYTKFDLVWDAWATDQAPCEGEGERVTERLKLSREVSNELVAADTAFGIRVSQALAAKSPDDAWKFLQGRFATGRKVGEDLSDAAKDLALERNRPLFEKFKKSGKMGQLDEEFSTTCVFGSEKLDPKDVAFKFGSVFSGSRHVYALCRTPFPIDKFSGDPDARVFLMLDNDTDLSNGVISEGELGPVTKWGQTQNFSGRFGMPQGLKEGARAGSYYVSIHVKRPKLGDETPVKGEFIWHADSK